MLEASGSVGLWENRKVNLAPDISDFQGPIGAKMVDIARLFPFPFINVLFHLY